jgi:hypothetical protein
VVAGLGDDHEAPRADCSAVRCVASTTSREQIPLGAPPDAKEGPQMLQPSATEGPVRLFCKALFACCNLQLDDRVPQFLIDAAARAERSHKHLPVLSRM